MAIAEHTCVTVECDGNCAGHGWDEGPWHFVSRELALTFVATQGWLVTNGRTLCPDCSKRADCEATGHQYDEDGWADCERRGVRFRTRSCTHCAATDYDPPFDQLMVLSKAAEVVDAAGKDA